MLQTMWTRISTLLLTPLIFFACKQEEDKLPILGEKQIEDGDTTYHTIAPFSYVNQDSLTITHDTFANGIYVADFFFTSCPTICPKVKRQMLRLQEAFASEDRVKILSLSIDYRKDSIPILKRYAEKVGIESGKWHLVQLAKDELEHVATQYFSIAYEDSDVPGGFDHSGRLLLVDDKRRIRAYCDGKDPEAVDEFMAQIRILLNEV